MHIKRFIALSASIISILSASASTHNPLISNTDSTRSTQWVDSVFANLTLRERVAQLFMVAGYTNKDKAHTDELTNFVTKEGVGGIIFFQGGPVRQVNLTNKLQQSAKVPLLISMDAEWGPGMRLDSTFSYPRQMMLGAIND
ncbi:MAG TPA: glycoside hydrolase family 3 N-terminal domain-containing protein, partial [Tenuifilaceae bacterium]|nr:glycoside hydrolase family 3 N-terminal domain-containing protein [Tenuifilaceae bacterium]